MSFLKKNAFLIILFLVFAFATIFFSSHFLTNWDAGQFALGTQNYNLETHQPHTPGYFLFVKSAQALHYLIENINICFIIINFIAGLLAICFFYKLIYLISNNSKTSFIISLILTLNPIFWYYHNIANTYIFEALAIILTAFFTYKAFLGHKNTFLYNSGIIALLMGFRPSIILSAAPLLLIHLIFAKYKLKKLLLGAIFFIIMFAAWFIPFSKIVGFDNFLDITKNQIQNSAGAFSKSSQLIFLAKSILFSISAALIFLFFYLKSNLKFIVEKKLYLFAIPAILLIIFYAFVHFGEVGYILGIIPLFLLFIIYPIQKISKKWWGIALIIIILIAQIYIFCVPQKYFTDPHIEKINYTTIKNHDQIIFNYTGLIAAQNPTTLVIVLRGQYLDENNEIQSYSNDDIRILGYYFPDYKLYDFAGVTSEYSVIENYNSEKFYSNSIKISQQTNKIIIIADYLNPIDYPDEFKIEENQIPQSQQMYYTGNIENINEFEFKGLFFTK